MKLKKMLKSKSFWTGVSAVVGGVFLISQGETEKGVGAIIGGLSVIFVRDAIGKVGK